MPASRLTTTMPRQIPILLLLLIFFGLYILPLGVRPLFIQDETRYAEVPREMISSGDWVVPRIDGLRYFEKPVLGYWLTAASISIFGVNNFAVRLPAALSTGLVALILFLLCNRYCGDGSTVPRLAVLIYLTSLGVTALGTYAVLDPALTLFLTAALVCFFLATEQHPGSGRERTMLLLAGAFAGGAFLVKGFLAFAVPVLVGVPYLLLRKRWLDILRFPWLPLAGALVVALPWSILISQRESDFWHYFFWNEHVRRFLFGNAQHKEPFWYFLAVLPAMFFPWIVHLPAIMTGLRHKQIRNPFEQRLLHFSLSWCIMPFLFFSASSGKLITYILPCFPPLAVLSALGIEAALAGGKIKKLQHGIVTAGVLVGLAMSVLVILQLAGPEDLLPFQTVRKWLPLVLALAVTLFFLAVSCRSQQGHQKLVFFAFAFCILFVTANFLTPLRAENSKAPGALLARHRLDIPRQTYVLCGEEIARAVCWYLHREDVYLVEKGGELAYGLQHENNSRRLLAPRAAGRFIRSHAGHAVLIASHKEYSRWQPFLPPPVSLDDSGAGGYLLVHY